MTAPKKPAGANGAALEKTIAALEGLSDSHAAVIEQARTLAREIDAGDQDAKKHGEYRQVIKILLEVGKKTEIGAFERLMREIKNAATET